MTAGATEGALLERDGRIARLTINRPRKRNALDTATLTDLTEAVRSIADDPEILVVVLAGAGGTFSAGADIQELRALTEESARAFITRIHELIDAVRGMPQVVIAAIEGYCFGGALELIAGCDLRIAAAGTVFGMPEILVGLPSVIEAALLVPLIGLGRTADLVLTGENVDAAEALRIGLVNRVAPAHLYAEAVETLAQRLAGFSGPALRSQKRLLRQWIEGSSLAEAVRVSIDEFALTYRSANPAEAQSAFLEKRSPRFPDR